MNHSCKRAQPLPASAGRGHILFQFQGVLELLGALGIFALQVLEEATTLVDLANQPTAGRVVLFVGAQVAGQFLDLGREDGNLYLGRPGVVLMRRELLNDVLLLALCQHRVGGGRARGWRDPWPRHRDELL